MQKTSEQGNTMLKPTKEQRIIEAMLQAIQKADSSQYEDATLYELAQAAYTASGVEELERENAKLKETILALRHTLSITSAEEEQSLRVKNLRLRVILDEISILAGNFAEGAGVPEFDQFLRIENRAKQALGETV